MVEVIFYLKNKEDIKITIESFAVETFNFTKNIILKCDNKITVLAPNSILYFEVLEVD